MIKEKSVKKIESDVSIRNEDNRAQTETKVNIGKAINIINAHSYKSENSHSSDTNSNLIKHKLKDIENFVRDDLSQDL